MVAGDPIFDANDHLLVLRGLGRMKLRWSYRPHCRECTKVPGCPFCPKPKTVTVCRDSAGRYFVSFSVEEPRREHAPAPNPIVALDLGLKNFITDSVGNVVEPYRALARSLAKLRQAQHKLSRRKRGSGRWKAQRRIVGRRYARVVDARHNFLHNVSRRLVNVNQVIVTETLNVRGIARNRRLARAIADAGWSDLVRQIAYKADWAGREHVQADQWFPSTKRRSSCHAIREGLTLADRRWRCDVCGADHDHDRDLNAAKNLAQESLRLLEVQRPGVARLLRAEGDTSGMVPARPGTEPASDETRTRWPISSDRRSARPPTASARRSHRARQPRTARDPQARARGPGEVTKVAGDAPNAHLRPETARIARSLLLLFGGIGGYSEPTLTGMCPTRFVVNQ